MVHQFMTKSYCAAILIVTVPTFLLAWYTYSSVWGGSGGARYWENHLTEEQDYLDYIHDSRLRQPTESFDDYINPVHFNKHNFQERQKINYSDKKAERNKKGKVYVYNPHRLVPRSSCVPFKTMKNGTRLCVYSKRDQFISSQIRDTGSWEPDLLAAMATALTSVPNMHVIDIGCNVGMYTVYAALMGRKVVAVDPISSNLYLLYSSLTYAGVHDNVHLLLNAVSDHVEPVKVLINRYNVGGSRIEPVSESTHNTNDTIVDSIVLDDLVRVVDFKKVFIKMDIEGHEVNVFRRASKFFQTFDVRYIMMEWMFQRHSPHGREICNFLIRNGFLPFKHITALQILNVEEYSAWPDNMIWIKR
ncbi:uncharacterized protein LOC124253717 [Haliotis rubra]|uniref:uncharacterized protein LOC124253717 n=1 Tax=Haliotis rubra TaxID=36100 RepID=UPI001EE509E0|nr:uncharacterized protein LOC124253717 [Haliotis rubra]